VIQGEARGELLFYRDAQTLQLYSIRTRETPDGRDLKLGTGSILIDWLATQAAFRGQHFSILGINQPRIFQILRNAPLLNPQFHTIEACRFRNPQGHRVVAIGKLQNREFLFQHMGKGFFNVRSPAHPNLLPPGLRSATALREGPYPYELNFTPFRNFLVPGHETNDRAPRRKRIAASVKSLERQGANDQFYEPGTYVVNWEVQEGEARGEATVFYPASQF
jgi:hypothetical protein